MSTTTQKINKTTFGGLALKGYDPVSYFTDGQAVEGRKEFAHEYAGAKWAVRQCRASRSLRCKS